MSPPRLARLLVLLVVVLGALVVPAAAGAQSPATTVVQVDPNKLEYQADLDVNPPGFRRTGRAIQAAADKVPLVVKERKKYKDSYAGVFRKGTTRWQVSYYDRYAKPIREIAQVTVDDATGRVTESYVGYKIAWTMARGYAGAFGRKVNSPWVWIPLTVLFLVPFIDWRRPFRPLHADLAAIAALGISVAYFNDAQIDRSVPVAYVLMAYLLARMLWIGVRSRAPTDRGRLSPIVPATWLAVGLVFLVGFRIGLNVTSSNVIDVGYSGVIGGDKLLKGERLYGTFPASDEHGDTYGPVNYAAYVPFVKILGWDGTWGDLPAAHGAAIAFDLICIALLILIGRRIRGPDLGWVLGYAWAACPFTLYVMNCNANDALVGVFLLLGLLGAASPAGRGAAMAFGALAKFVSIPLIPLWASQGGWKVRSVLLYGGAFLLAALLAMAPVLIHGESLQTMYERTFGFQDDRGSPFSIWGLYSLQGLQRIWQALAILLALAVAVFPRRPDVVGLAALGGAVMIATQASISHWFYLYIVWFLPLVLVASFARSTSSRPA